MESGSYQTYQIRVSVDDIASLGGITPPGVDGGPVFVGETDTVWFWLTSLPTGFTPSNDGSTGAKPGTSGFFVNSATILARTIGQPYDFVVRKFSDLPTPVAGIITLTDGSWIISSPVDIGTNTIRIPNGATVSLDGQAPGARLSSSAAVALDIQASAAVQLRHLAVSNAVGDCVHVANDFLAEASIVDCDFDASNTCLLVTSGAVRVDAQRSKNFVNAIIAQGVSEVAVSCSYFTSGDTAIEMNGGSIIVTDCYFLNLNRAILVGAGGGNSMQLVACRLQNMATGISGAAGVTSATLSNVRLTNMGTGISWAAANIPTNGLSIAACSFDNIATNLGGFTQASPRVILRGNLQAGGLMSETIPLVP